MDWKHPVQVRISDNMIIDQCIQNELISLDLKDLHLIYSDGICFTLINEIKNHFMRSLLYIIAVILIISWVLGAFVYSAGSIIHILLVLAIISFLLTFIRRGTV